MNAVVDNTPKTLAAITVDAAPPSATVRIRYAFRSRVLLPRPRRVVSFNDVVEVPADVAAELLAIDPPRFVLADNPALPLPLGEGRGEGGNPKAADDVDPGPRPAPAPDPAGPAQLAPGPVAPAPAAREQPAPDPTPAPAIVPPEAPSTSR